MKSIAIHSQNDPQHAICYIHNAIEVKLLKAIRLEKLFHTPDLKDIHSQKGVGFYFRRSLPFKTFTVKYEGWDDQGSTRMDYYNIVRYTDYEDEEHECDIKLRTFNGSDLNRFKLIFSEGELITYENERDTLYCYA